MTSRRFLSLAAACVIGTMALAVPTLPVQAAPTSASTIVAVASVAPQTDAVSVSPAPASSHNVLAPTRRFRYHGGRGSSDPVFGTISVIIFIGLCVWNVYNRRRRSRIAQGRLQQNPPAYGGPAGPQYGAVTPHLQRRGFFRSASDALPAERRWHIDDAKHRLRVWGRSRPAGILSAPAGRTGLRPVPAHLSLDCDPHPARPKPMEIR